MRYVIINGKRYRTVRERLSVSRVVTGTILVERGGRRAYRVVAIDGSDAILRNARKAHLIEAVPLTEVVGEYSKVVPLDKGL